MAVFAYMAGLAMQNDRGATLIELVLVIVVLGIAATLLLQLTGQSNVQSAQSLVANQSRYIANHTLSEVLNKPVFDPDDLNCNNLPSICPARAEAANARITWDNVCDYNGYTGEPVSANGTSLGLSQYQVSIVVNDSAELNGVNNNSEPNILKIIVTVNSPTGESVSYTGWRFAMERWQC